jgi:DNA-binding transcriptional MerR regulator
MECVDRVRLIQRALFIGFSLNELAKFFAERERGGVPCRSVRASVERHLTELDAKLRELRALKRDLRALLQDWDTKLAMTPAGQQARLLDHLDARRKFGNDTDAPRQISTHARKNAAHLKNRRASHS